MNAAHVRAEAAISTRNGLTVDFADFAIATLRWCQVKAVTELVSATLSDADCTAVYLFHDRVPYSRATLPDPARPIRDDHHDLGISSRCWPRSTSSSLAERSQGSAVDAAAWAQIC
jgi:hypothetical protein